MRLTVLIENTGPEGLVHEHGLSLLIVHGGHTILLDGGATGRALDNARTLGLDISAVDTVVLSHGHFDHGDGLPAFLRETKAPVYLRKTALEPRYHGEEPGARYIGLSREAIEAIRPRARFVDGVTALYPGAWLVPDGVDHEQSLVLACRAGLVICNSCCHAGVGYIVREVRETFRGREVAAVVGGFHLMGKDGPMTLGVAPGIVKNLGDWLALELGVKLVYTGHCTGKPGFELLREGHPDRVRALTTGLTLEFEE